MSAPVTVTPRHVGEKGVGKATRGRKVFREDPLE